MTKNTLPETQADWNSHARASASQRWRQQSAAMGRKVTEAIVLEAAVQPGETVLDVACGTGEPAISLASLVGESGSVTGIDISTEPLKTANERAIVRGLKNTRFFQADVHNLPFPDATFDCITSRLGVMFFADLPRALGELHRVLKPGGRMAILAWGPMKQPYFETMIGTLLQTIPGAEVPVAACAMFKFGDPQVLGEAASKAGFVDVKARLASVPWNWPGTAAELWSYFQDVTVPFRALIEKIPEERRSEIDAAVCKAIERYKRYDAIEFTAQVTIVSARK